MGDERSGGRAGRDEQRERHLGRHRFDGFGFAKGAGGYGIGRRQLVELLVDERLVDADDGSPGGVDSLGRNKGLPKVTASAEALFCDSAV